MYRVDDQLSVDGYSFFITLISISDYHVVNCSVCT